MKEPLVSIIITNFNYGSFLRESIESALCQSYPKKEVIVVDDGSTDQSREIIASYGNTIVRLFKENGGQSSAFNSGLMASRGQIVVFLDADDGLLPEALEKVVTLFDEGEVVKVHWPLWIVDSRGKKMGGMKPSRKIQEGDLREVVVRDGPDSAIWPPTSGNAWAREFLERVFPLPEIEKECGVGSASADAFLSMLAPLFGFIKRITEPQGFYRLHGRNDHSAMSFDKKLERDLRLFDYRSVVLSNYCQRMNISVEPEKWRDDSWFYRLKLATQEIARLVGPENFILVDDNTWMMNDNENHHVIPFLERGGKYWGPPPDDDTAIRELERLRKSGASYLVFAWPSFWWLDYYSEFNRHIRARSRCILDDRNIIAFDLRH